MSTYRAKNEKSWPRTFGASNWENAPKNDGDMMTIYQKDKSQLDRAPTGQILNILNMNKINKNNKTIAHWIKLETMSPYWYKLMNQ